MGTMQAMPPEVILALKGGNKVEAIKHIRATQNLSLKEAKDFIEGYLEQSSTVKDQFAVNKRIKISDTGWLIIAVVVVGIYYFITGGL